MKKRKEKDKEIQFPAFLTRSSEMRTKMTLSDTQTDRLRLRLRIRIRQTDNALVYLGCELMFKIRPSFA